MKNIIKCTLIIIGTLIGAGYASGQEIMTFFNQFDINGIFGIIISSLLFGIMTYAVMSIANKKGIVKYNELINNKYIIFIIKVFALICFCVMVAATGTYVNEQYGVNYWIGTSAICSVCFIAFLLKFYGLEKINNILVPLILIGIVMLSFSTKQGFDNVVLENNNKFQISLLNNWIQSAILYAGYNMIVLIPIIIELNRYKLNKKEISVLSIFITLALCVTGLMIFFTIDKYYPSIKYAELPTLNIAKQANQFVYWYYNIIIILAIFTTAFSCGYAFLELGAEKNYFKNCIVLCLLGVLLSKIGFSNLISFCFPVFGYLGFVQFFFLLNKKSNE